MIKFIPYVKQFGEYYTETVQSNNLRWTLLYKNAAGEFLEQTMMFKCKDFFNDIVAKYHGTEIELYGMDTTKLKLNEEGMYVKLKFVAAAFLENVGSINSYAAQWAMPPIDVVDAGKEDGEPRALLFIPREYFDNTYFISLLTYLIRVSNIDVPLIGATFMEHPTKGVDNPFREKYGTVIKNGFVLPMESLDKFYVRSPETHTDTPTKIHNCGCKCWVDMAIWHESQKKADAMTKEYA